MSLKGYSALACGMLLLITSVYCWHILGLFHLSVIWRWGQEEEACWFPNLGPEVAVQRALALCGSDIHRWANELRGGGLTTALLLKPFLAVTRHRKQGLDMYVHCCPAVQDALVWDALMPRASAGNDVRPMVGSWCQHEQVVFALLETSQFLSSSSFRLHRIQGGSCLHRSRPILMKQPSWCRQKPLRSWGKPEALKWERVLLQHLLHCCGFCSRTPPILSD